MTAMRDLLVFSDLDGTLLDHETYSWAPAAAALDLLRAEGAGVVLASSKTAAEMAGLRDDIGFATWPSIVENGSGILEPGEESVGSVYEKLRGVIERLPQGFRGFGNMSVEELVTRTGLTPEAARNAKDRQFSEPGIWEGDQKALEIFLSAARDAGLTAQRGGRFLTLSFGSTKADRVAELIERFCPNHTIVLGDAPNDIEMLKLADTGVIVANPASTPLPRQPGEETGQIMRTTRPGPEGWAEAIFGIIEELSITKDARAHG